MTFIVVKKGRSSHKLFRIVQIEKFGFKKKKGWTKFVYFSSIWMDKNGRSYDINPRILR